MNASFLYVKLTGLCLPELGGILTVCIKIIILNTKSIILNSKSTI